MESFCNRRSGSGHHSLAIIVLLPLIGVALVASGCAGLVSGTSSAPGGPTPLSISSVALSVASPTSVIVSWQTSVAANSQVEYGTSSTYGSSTPLDPAMVVSHVQTLSALKTGAVYHYRVHSTDPNNNSAVSGDLTFTAASDTTPPSVSITSPGPSAVLSATVTLTASASDNIGVASVQFKVDSLNVGPAITTTPYSYALNTSTFSNGNHLVSATATDTSGNTATSVAVPVTVSNTSPDTTPPTVSLSAPVSGATVSGSGVLISVNATDNVAVASVQLQLDGVNLGAALTAAPYQFSWDSTKTSNGSHTLRAIAKDTSNNSTTSSTVTISVSNTLDAPVVALTSPANNSTVGGTISISATATDAGSAI